MNQRKRPKRVRQSILDRLIQNREPPPQRWEDSVELLKENLLRDLEWLLNTRETGDPATAPWPELEHSIFNYGLPDFASMSADSAKTPGRLLKAIEREVELFEPRLTHVRISLQEKRDGEERSLRFVIEATLRLDPDPELVEFDSVLEMDSGRFSLNR